MAATRALEGMRGHESRLAARFEALLRVNDGLAADREALQSAREVALNDVDLLLRLRMGQASKGGDRERRKERTATPPSLILPPPSLQDEVAGETLVPAYGDAVLAPQALVGSVNDEIRRLGGQRVDALSEVRPVSLSPSPLPSGCQRTALLLPSPRQIRDFRRNLLYCHWEQAYLQATMGDQAELQRDIQLLRAMGPMGEFIKGARQERGGGEEQRAGGARASRGSPNPLLLPPGVNIATRARQEVDKAEARGRYMSDAHRRNVDKLRAQAGRSEAQAAALRGELAAMEAKQEALQVRRGGGGKIRGRHVLCHSSPPPSSSPGDGRRAPGRRAGARGPLALPVARRRRGQWQRRRRALPHAHAGGACQDVSDRARAGVGARLASQGARPPPPEGLPCLPRVTAHVGGGEGRPSLPSPCEGSAA